MTISLNDFGALSLPAHVLANLTQLGYTSMTPIQAAALPVALLGKDLIAQAKTGSGKTAAFALALLANLNARRFSGICLGNSPWRSADADWPGPSGRSIFALATAL